MATSKSNDSLRDCIGGACIFSGRPDPTWRIDDAVAARLESLWSAMPSYTGSLPVPKPLGYRGCFVRCDNRGEWFAYGGVVTLKTFDRKESRLDTGSLFERLLLDSAPDRVLPEGMF